MASVRPETRNQQGSPVAASSSISSSRDACSGRAVNIYSAKTSVYSPRPSPELQQQQQLPVEGRSQSQTEAVRGETLLRVQRARETVVDFIDAMDRVSTQAQQQQQPSEERSQYQTEVVIGETSQAVHQSQAQEIVEDFIEEIDRVSPQAQQRPERDDDQTLSFPWPRFVKKGGFVVALLALILGIGMIAPTVGQYATGVWSAAKDYQDWCKGEQSVNRTLTDICKVVVDKPLPPPPGIKQVFGDIRPRGTEHAVSSIWDRLADLLGAYLSFLRSPVGVSLALMLLSYTMLAIGFDGKQVELVAYQFFLTFLTFGTEGKWLTLLGMIFLSSSYFELESHLWFFGYIFALMDSVLWLRDGGLKEPPWVQRVVLLAVCVVAFLHAQSRATRFSILSMSILVPGETFSHKLVALWKFLTGMWQVTSLSVSVLRCLV